MKPADHESRQGIQSQKPTGPTGIQAEEPIPPWELPGAFRRDCEPHRGNLLWWMGVTSLATTIPFPVSAFLAPLGLPLALITWRLALRDLARLRKGLLDPAGERLTREARIFSLVALILGCPSGLWGLMFLAEVLH